MPTINNSPESLLASVEETVPTEFADVYYRNCNLTLYQQTPYKKAWDHAQNNDYAKGAELFNHFIKVTRKGQTHVWRQDVCDGWPHSLFECKRHPKLNINICQCLYLKSLTKFEAVMENIEVENGTREMAVCRVKIGYHCEATSTVLRCGNMVECISDVCRTVNLEPSLILVAIFAYFSFNRFI